MQGGGRKGKQGLSRLLPSESWVPEVLAECRKAGSHGSPEGRTQVPTKGRMCRGEG